MILMQSRNYLSSNTTVATIICALPFAMLVTMHEKGIVML